MDQKDRSQEAGTSRNGKTDPQQPGSLQTGQSSGAHSAQHSHPFQYHNIGIASVVSMIFPGGGQFYNGQTSKGVLFMVAAAVEMVTIILRPRIAYPVLGLGFIFWLVGIIDAGLIASRLIRRERIQPFQWF